VIVDYHMHLRAPDESIDHTVEAAERFVAVAAERGVDEIGFTEHVYYFEQTRHLWSMPYHLERCVYDIEPYVGAVLEAKRRGHPIKLGIEVDYEPGREEETADALAPYPWDYVLGSIHFLDGLGIDAVPSLVDSVGPEAAWSRYYETLASAARSGLFDSLAHPDLIKFHGEEIDWGDFVCVEGGEVVRQIAAGEESTVDFWVEGFDAAVENLGETGDLGDGEGRNSGFSEC